jgi:hypothetical protein
MSYIIVSEETDADRTKETTMESTTWALTVTEIKSKVTGTIYQDISYGPLRVGTIEKGQDIRAHVAKYVDGKQLTAEALDAPIAFWNKKTRTFIESGY